MCQKLAVQKSVAILYKLQKRKLNGQAMTTENIF